MEMMVQSQLGEYNGTIFNNKKKLKKIENDKIMVQYSIIKKLKLEKDKS